MTQNFRVNLVSNYGGWGTAVESSTIFHHIAMLQAWILTFMVIKTTLIPKQNKAYQTRSRVNDFLYILREKNVREFTFWS